MQVRDVVVVGLRAAVATVFVAATVISHGTAGAQEGQPMDRLVFERDLEIHVVDADGGDEQVIAPRVDGEEYFFDPDLSPDGQRVVATRCAEPTGGGQCALVHMAIDGSDERAVPVPAELGAVSGGAWSPDGERLAFVSTRRGAEGQLPVQRVLVIDAGGGDPRDVAAGGHVEWSPEGSLLVASQEGGDAALRLVHLDGRPSALLRTVRAGVADAVWSPDGTKIALTLALPTSVGITQPDFVYVMNADGSGTRGLDDRRRPGRVPLDAGLSEIAWTPDSEGLVVTGAVHDLAGTFIRTLAEGAGSASWGQPAGAPAPCDDGYWLVASDGGVFSFGDAGFHGSTGGMRLDAPVVAAAATPSGAGYWLVAADGGVFSFGDARFRGSAGGAGGSPVRAIAATDDGNGYWLVAEAGEVHAFGDAPVVGDAAAATSEPSLGSPVVAGAGTLLLATADGQTVPLGDVDFCGSRYRLPLAGPVVGAAVTP